MKLQNKPKILAATRNYSGDKMFTVMCDIPYCLLEYFLRFKELNITYKKIEDIELQEVLANPFVPIWTKQQKGMSGEILDIDEDLEYHYEYAINSVVNNYNNLLDFGVHKQNANRLLAPFAYTTCILSGTEWDNFFELRCPKYEFDGTYFLSKKQLHHYLVCNDMMTLDKKEPEWEIFCQSINKSTAQPEFQVIAEQIYDLYQEANWKVSKYHIPFEDEIEEQWSALEILMHSEESEYYRDVVMKISASMCAKLSYNTQDNEDTLEKHLERANMLIEHKHYEPFSHQAVAMNEEEYGLFYKSRIVNVSKMKGQDGHFNPLNNTLIEYGWCYNLRGFISQRYAIENL